MWEVRGRVRAGALSIIPVVSLDKIFLAFPSTSSRGQPGKQKHTVSDSQGAI